MTKKKLIEKYERVLASRENQIEDLSSEIGIVNCTFNSTINIQYYIMKIFFSKINLLKKRRTFITRIEK